MSGRILAWRRLSAFACIAIGATGCTVTPLNDAPIVERSQAAGAAPPAARAAHDGMYVVQPGDTLYSIALAFGQDFRDIARWNGLDDPTQIHVGQALRVAPPPAAAAAAEESGAAEATPVPVTPSATLEAHPLAPAVPVQPGPAAAEGTPAQAQPTDKAAAAPPPPTPPEQAMAAVPPPSEKPPAAEPEGMWAWPSEGKLLERFDDRNKGIDIGGNVGDPVYAANDGQVVYSGSGLRGYGKLVIIKHTDDFVSAYGHNNEILVTQGQAVKRGQRIADLGMTDAPTPRLHFEIRRRGTPVDPLTYLPPR